MQLTPQQKSTHIKKFDLWDCLVVTDLSGTGDYKHTGWTTRRLNFNHGITVGS